MLGEAWRVLFASGHPRCLDKAFPAFSRAGLEMEGLRARGAALVFRKSIHNMAALSGCLTLAMLAVLGLLRLLNDWSAVSAAGRDYLRRTHLMHDTPASSLQTAQPITRRMTLLVARQPDPAYPPWEVGDLMRARSKWARSHCYLDPRGGATENILVYLSSRQDQQQAAGNHQTQQNNGTQDHVIAAKGNKSHVIKNVTGGHDAKSDVSGLKRDVRIVTRGQSAGSDTGKRSKDETGGGKGQREILRSRSGHGDDLSYCVIPKAGCTFWIRIFRFLNNDTGGLNVSSPFQISRTLAHNAGNRKMKMFRLEDPKDKATVLRTKRILFARNPFSRLYSAFLDKFFLPDYWKTVGRKIIREQRKNASDLSLRCGHDVTFVEFLRHILKTVQKSGPRSLDGHWRPIQHQCSPCEFRPDYIGLHETFAADAEYILRKHGLGHIWAAYNHDSHILDEVQLNTRYMFMKAAPLIKDDCTSAREMSKRLWEAFKINGYLSPDAKLDEYFRRGKASESSFVEFVSQTISKGRRMSADETSSQRRLMLAHAFNQVPRSLLQDIVDIYAMDFKYFGYNSHPLDIFPQ